MRDWSHDRHKATTKILHGGARTCGSDGGRTWGRSRLAMGGHRVDFRQDRVTQCPAPPPAMRQILIQFPGLPGAGHKFRISSSPKRFLAIPKPHNLFCGKYQICGSVIRGQDISASIARLNQSGASGVLPAMCSMGRINFCSMCNNFKLTMLIYCSE